MTRMTGILVSQTMASCGVGPRLFHAPTRTTSSGCFMLISEAIRDVEQTRVGPITGMRRLSITVTTWWISGTRVYHKSRNRYRTMGRHLETGLSFKISNNFEIFDFDAHCSIFYAILRPNISQDIDSHPHRLTHWGLVINVCVSEHRHHLGQVINGLSHDRCQASSFNQWWLILFRLVLNDKMLKKSMDFWGFHRNLISWLIHIRCWPGLPVAICSASSWPMWNHLT